MKMANSNKFVSLEFETSTNVVLLNAKTSTDYLSFSVKRLALWKNDVWSSSEFASSIARPSPERMKHESLEMNLSQIGIWTPK